MPTSPNAFVAVVAALLLGCSSMPEPGTPEAARACESLRKNVEDVERYYPDSEGADWGNDVARASFLLQAAEYSVELRCTGIDLGEFAPLPEEMWP